MTSTAVLEIIDLTDSPPRDNETQKVSNYSTYQDAEKNTMRAARKRKNGEALSYPGKTPDDSLEHGHAQSGESTETQPAVDAQESAREPKGKKKRRSKKNKDMESKVSDSVPPSREDAPPDALPTLDNEQLFFVDTAPTAVPEDFAFDSARDDKLAPSSSRTSGTPPPDKIPLLLPAHVSVLDPGEDLLVRTIQPAESDSDTDSYIEYLDYDDRMVRSQHFLLLT
jgi:protein AIR1/2